MCEYQYSYPLTVPKWLYMGPLFIAMDRHLGLGLGVGLSLWDRQKKQRSWQKLIFQLHKKGSKRSLSVFHRIIAMLPRYRINLIFAYLFDFICWLWLRGIYSQKISYIFCKNPSASKKNQSKIHEDLSFRKISYALRIGEMPIGFDIILKKQKFSAESSFRGIHFGLTSKVNSAESLFRGVYCLRENNSFRVFRGFRDFRGIHLASMKLLFLQWSSSFHCQA